MADGVPVVDDGWGGLLWYTSLRQIVPALVLHASIKRGMGTLLSSWNMYMPLVHGKEVENQMRSS